MCFNCFNIQYMIANLIYLVKAHQKFNLSLFIFTLLFIFMLLTVDRVWNVRPQIHFYFESSNCVHVYLITVAKYSIHGHCVPVAIRYISAMSSMLSKKKSHFLDPHRIRRIFSYLSPLHSSINSTLRLHFAVALRKLFYLFSLFNRHGW